MSHCLKCFKEVYDHHTQMCQSHYYNRKQKYKYAGHKFVLISDLIDRKCLKCDKIFASAGNRKCDTCNSLDAFDADTTASAFVRC